jgi:hypothetical protein
MMTPPLRVNSEVLLALHFHDVIWPGINVCESVLQGLFFDAIDHDYSVRDLACVEFEPEFLHCGEDSRGGLGWFGVRAGRSDVWKFRRPNQSEVVPAGEAGLIDYWSIQVDGKRAGDGARG